MQDDRTKWEGIAQVAAVTSEDLHWRKARLSTMQLPSCGTMMVKNFEKASSGAAAQVHAGQLCVVLTCTRPKNFPHVNERLARDLSRVPDFHVARYGTRLRLTGMCYKRT